MFKILSHGAGFLKLTHYRQATGGPCQYHGRDMIETHADLGITQAEWDHAVVLFKEVLAKHNVPEAETQELLTIVGSTMGDIVTAGQ